MAPAQPGAQVFAQLEVSRGQFARGQQPALMGLGIHEPVESRMLLHGGVEVYVIQQHHRPGLIEFGRLQHRGVHPAGSRTLFPQRLAHGLEQVRLAAARGTPQIGGNG